MTKKTEEAVKSAVKKVDKTKKPKKAREEKKPSDKLADKSALTKFLQGIFGDPQKKILKKLWKRAKEIGDLEPKYEAMSDDELKAQTEKFRKKMGYSFPMGLDTDSSVYKLYAQTYIPRNFLIDKSGRVVKASVGYDEAEFAELVKLIEKTIKK